MWDTRASLHCCGPSLSVHGGCRIQGHLCIAEVPVLAYIVDAEGRVIVLDLEKALHIYSRSFHLENLIDTSNTTPMKLWQFSNYFYGSIFSATLIFLEIEKKYNENVPGTRFVTFPTATKTKETWKSKKQAPMKCDVLMVLSLCSRVCLKLNYISKLPKPFSCHSQHMGSPSVTLDNLENNTYNLYNFLH